MNKVLEVILKLNDQFTAPLRQSETGLSGFAGGVGKMVAQWVSFTAISAAVVVALDKAFSAFDVYRVSLLKLEGAAKITGVALETLTAISEAAQRQFGLSKAQAADFAVEMAKLATKAGDVGAASQALQKFLDIGAARGLTAAETLKAVQQSILGIDEGTDKLFNKNPSVLYKEFADSIGTTAAKLTDQQKAQALLNAAMEDGGKVVGAYGEYLNSTAGAAEQAGNRTESFFARLGEFLDPVRRLWIEVKTGLVNVGAVALFTMEAIGASTVAAIDGAWQYVKALVGGGANLLGSFLHLVAKVSGPLKDEIDAVSVKLVGWGEGVKKSSFDNLRLTAGAWKTRMAEIYGVAESGEEQITATGKTHAAARVEETVKEGKAKAAASKESAAELVKIQEEAARIIAEVWGESAEEIERFIDDVVAEANLLVGVQEALLATINDGMATVTEGAEGAKDATKGIGDEALNAARGAVSLAEEFGGLDKQSASVLNNVVNLADSLKNGFKDMAAGDMLGAIGAVAGILGSIFGGNPAHMALVRKNTERLAELRDRMGEILELNAPGAKVSAVQGLNFEDIVGTAITTNGRISAAKLTTYLAGKGLSLRDFREIAKDAGFDLDERNGTLDTGAVKDFIAGMKTAGTVGFGGDFAGQLGKNDFLNSILGVEGDGALAGLAEILKDPKNGSSVFASIFEGVNLADGVDDEERRIMRGRLGVLAQRYATGALSAADLNGLSNAQAGQVFSRISDLLGDPSVTGAGAAGIGAGSAPGNAFAGVTFASASYDLSVVLFGPIERIDTNLADIRAGVGTLVGLSTEIADNTARAAAYAASTAAAMSGTGLADMVDERLAAARDLSSAAEG